MASLTGQSINSTYPGLLKTSDNAELGIATARVITDGNGNDTPLQIAQEKVIVQQDNQYFEINDTQATMKGDVVYLADPTDTNYFGIAGTGAAFGGSVDFSAATVTGLPGGGGGLTGVSSTTQVSHSGPDGSDLIFASITIPANTFTAGDIIQIKTMNTQDFTGGGWIYQAMWISNSTGVFSGYSIGSAADTSSQSKFYAKTGLIHTANGTGDATSFHGADLDSTDQNANGLAPYSDRATTPIDWTSDVYINVTCFVDNAGSSITNRGFNIVKINA